MTENLAHEAIITRHARMACSLDVLPPAEFADRLVALDHAGAVGRPYVPGVFMRRVRLYRNLFGATEAGR